MFSFIKIATIAALVFSGLASAIPSPVPVSAPEARTLMDRSSGKSVANILTTLTSDLTKPCSELTYLTSANATTVNVQVYVLQIKVLLQTATTACGTSSSLGVGNVLTLLAAVIELIVSACSHALSVCTDKSSILSICQILDSVLASLISTVCTLVSGIFSSVLSVVTSILTGLLGSVVQSITSLHFTACEKALFLI